jgi:hypothetical protein
MNKTDKAFRLIVLRRPREQDLFEDKSLYGIVPANVEKREAALLALSR